MVKIIVSQYEARHRYTIPRLFYQMGYLSQLVTGSHADSFLGKVTRTASKIFPLSPQLLRLTERKIQGIPQELILGIDAFTWQERQVQTLYKKGDMAGWLNARDNAWFSLIRHGIKLDQADCLYTMGGQNLKLLKEAQKLGVKVIVDVFISPLNWRQTFLEKQKIGLEPSIMETKHHEIEAHYQKIFDNSYIILCPSQWVAEGVLALDSQFQSKIQICPYGSSLKFIASQRNPTPGRIFWAGSDWFRKGLHYLGEVADHLKPKYPNLDFRIAGITDPNVIAMPRFKNLNFLGKLNSSEMENEFAQADLFVFPTLTEGMSGVVIEAIASGCPVITTRGAGIDGIESGKNGLIIDPLSSEALSQAIENLFLDRKLLAAMSQASYQLSRHYTEEAWRLRLEKLVKSIMN